MILAAPLSAAIQTVRFSVSGWTCGSCATASRIALKRLDGVQDVTTEIETKEAVVRYDDTKVSPEKMAAALRKLGYVAAVRKEGSSERAAPSASSAGPVTFFQVPLGCPAVENLGCGSLAMPLLEDLERNPKIAEAWIDHAGRVLAVVWKGKAPSAAEAAWEVDKAFKQGDLPEWASEASDAALEAEPLTGSRAEEAGRSFANRQRWYRGGDVAKLSKEEARVLAARLVEPVERDLGAERAASLRGEFTSAFERCFLGDKPLVREDFEKIARKYVGDKGLEKMAAAMEYCTPEEQ